MSASGDVDAHPSPIRAASFTDCSPNAETITGGGSSGSV
jgi:hypothetical protein